MNWWLFIQVLVLSAFTYTIVMMAYISLNPLIAIFGIAVLMTVLICLVYYYSRDIPTQDVVPASPPQKPVQAAYVCEAEDIVVRAWAEYDEAERQELEEEA